MSEEKTKALSEWHSINTMIDALADLVLTKIPKEREGYDDVVEIFDQLRWASQAAQRHIKDLRER